MKYLLSLVLMAISLNAEVYYAKVEPFDLYTIKSSASGSVVNVYKDAEGKISKGGVLIQIDDYLNQKELKSSQKKLEALKKSYALIEKNLENSKKIEQIKKDNYDRVKNLKTKSKVSKDAELINYINASNQVVTLENSLQNLQVSISDLEYKVAYLKDTISKKMVKIKKDFLIYKIYVNEGDFVNMGTLLADVYDVTKAKATIYLSRDDVKDVNNSIIYINDKPTDYKINKIWKVADSQNISSYRAEIVLDKPKIFSELLKIELKKK